MYAGVEVGKRTVAIVGRVNARKVEIFYFDKSKDKWCALHANQDVLLRNLADCKADDNEAKQRLR